jgi:hypothetical protein
MLMKRQLTLGVMVLVLGLIVGPVSADTTPRDRPPDLVRLNLLSGQFEYPLGNPIGNQLPAGQPFYIHHGWNVNIGEAGEGLGSALDFLVRIELQDGPRILSSPDYWLRTGKELCPDRDQCYGFVHLFPEGLPEGTHVFQGWWYNDCEGWVFTGELDECDDPRQKFSPGPFVEGLEIGFTAEP